MASSGRPGQQDVEVRGNVLDPVDLIDGIGLGPAAGQRSPGLKPGDAPEDRRRHREGIPEGIPRLRCRRAALHLCRHGRPGRCLVNFGPRSEGYRNFATSCGTPPGFCADEHRGAGCAWPTSPASARPATTISRRPTAGSAVSCRRSSRPSPRLLRLPAGQRRQRDL